MEIDAFFNLISTVALILALTGNILINFKKKIGYIVWILSNIAWIYVNLITIQPNYPQIIMYLVYIGLNIQGYLYWNRKEECNENN